MGKRGQAISEQEWAQYDKQLRALHKDWHYLYKLVEGYAGARFDSRELEVAFINLKGRISCDYPLLARWRKEGHEIPREISAFFDRGASLKTLARELQEGGRSAEEWQLVDEALGYIRQILEEARNCAKPGRPIRVPDEFFKPHASEQLIDSYTRQFHAFRLDWQRLYALAQESLRPGVDRGALETELIQLRSKLSCDYPTLPRWFGGRDEIAKGIGGLLTNSTSLEALSTGMGRNGRIGRDWVAVDQGVATVCEELGRARTLLQNGRSSAIVDDLFTPPGKRGLPIASILKWTASTGLVLFLILTLYVMRNFLGFWAPDAGEGIEVNASLEDTEKVDALLSVANHACSVGDVDLFMTAIARDFEDDEGNGRRALRVIVQAYQTAGRMEQAWFDWRRTRVTRQDEWIYAAPVFIRSNLEDEDLITLRVGFKQYGERWLIAYAEGHN